MKAAMSVADSLQAPIYLFATDDGKALYGTRTLKEGGLREVRQEDFEAEEGEGEFVRLGAFVRPFPVVEVVVVDDGEGKEMVLKETVLKEAILKETGLKEETVLKEDGEEGPRKRQRI